MAEIVLENLSKRYDEKKNSKLVVKNLNLKIEDGSFTVLVGPSGCGKSTTLRMIAGLEKQSGGHIYIDGVDVSNVEPAKRDVAMVFQNYALYPTMTVRENIEFGLINNKVPKERREDLISEISDIVSLSEYLDVLPKNLSGGQRQRVALARAMVKKPKVFIFDEPLSNLDAKLRVQMRKELIKLHKKLETTFVYVTHDQVEAMSMGDKIVVLNKGEIMQIDSPIDLYNYPKNLFSAQFIGTPPMNIFKRESAQKYLLNADENINYMGFRPEDGKLSKTRPKTSEFIFAGEIISSEVLGSEIVYLISTRFGDMQVKSFNRDILDKKVYITVKKDDFKFFDIRGNSIKADISFIDYMPEIEGNVS